MNLFIKRAVRIFLAVTMIASATFAADGYKPGDRARNFTLKNIDGKMVSTADYKEAKGFIVVFTCNHCPFAKAYEDRIISLDKRYATEGYPVLAINPNDKDREPEDSFNNMVVRSREKDFPFPYLYDESQEIAKAYGAARTPHVYILSKIKNDLTVEYIGAIDDNTEDASEAKEKYVEKALNSLISRKPVETPFTKAIGCTIKWKKQN